MPLKITNSSRHMTLDAWVMANIVQLWTDHFCARFVTSDPRFRPQQGQAPSGMLFDPTGRQYDQMTQAARSGVANIAEGVSRRDTSRATEMKLLDVARASLQELKQDYLHFLLLQGQTPWRNSSLEAQSLRNIYLQKPEYGDDWDYDSSVHTLQQKALFDRYLLNTDSVTSARTLIILCNKAVALLQKFIDQRLEDFRQEGGFSENLSKDRNEALADQSQQGGAPSCPKCGAPMIKKIAQKGPRAGKAFWSCSRYQTRECDGTISIEP